MYFSKSFVSTNAIPNHIIVNNKNIVIVHETYINKRRERKNCKQMLFSIRNSLLRSKGVAQNLFYRNKNALQSSLPSVYHSNNSRLLYSTSATTENSDEKKTIDSLNPTTTPIIDKEAIAAVAEKPRGRLFFIKLVNSPFHKSKHIRDSFEALGLKKLQQLVVHKDTSPIRGLIFRVRNFVEVESVSTAEFFPEGTDHIEIERKSRKELREEWIEMKKEKRKKTKSYLKEAEVILAEFKAKAGESKQ